MGVLLHLLISDGLGLGLRLVALYVRAVRVSRRASRPRGEA